MKIWTYQLYDVVWNELPLVYGSDIFVPLKRSLSAMVSFMEIPVWLYP